MDDDPAAAKAQERADIEQRVRAGQWIRIADLATLFDVHHGSAHRWTKRRTAKGEPLIRTRPTSPVGGTAPLECHPEDVLNLLRTQRGEERS